eukprot:7298638-Lingulodinium_polyedra.AAC.1
MRLASSGRQPPAPHHRRRATGHQASAPSAACAVRGPPWLARPCRPHGSATSTSFTSPPALLSELSCQPGRVKSSAS